jgi:pimeloyl-ACP methyl ester carboxylesterase
VQASTDAALPGEQAVIVEAAAGPIPAVDQGDGQAVLILHGGSGDLTAWKPVADGLAQRFRVVRFTRPTYRVDPPPGGADAFRREVAEALAVARWIGEPVILVGHSSGAIVGLEAVLADPAPFDALVAYEPPLDATHGPERAQALQRARAALDAGSPLEAMQIHLRDLVGMPDSVVDAMFKAPASREALARFAPGQIADDEMTDALPEGMARFEALTLPVLLLGGENSPDHLQRRSDELASSLPRAPHRVVLAGQGHIAHLQAPDALARAITDFIDGLAIAGPDS